MSNVSSVGTSAVPSFVVEPDAASQTQSLRSAQAAESVARSGATVLLCPASNDFRLTSSGPPEGTGTVRDQAEQAALNGMLTTAAALRETAGLTDLHLQVALRSLGKNAPISGEPTATAGYDSRVCAPPEDVFDAFVREPERAFAAAGLTLHPKPTELQTGTRFFIEDRSGPVPIWAPVEVTVDREKKTITFTCLDGHPIRGVNRFELASDGAGGTHVKQRSEFQGSSTVPTAIGVHLVGAIERQHEIWRGVHGHLATVGGK